MSQATGQRGSKVAETNLQEIERLVSQNPTPDRVAAKLANLLNVQRTEVALLIAEDGLLKFLYPAELRTAGAIPISSNAVAARTASTRIPLLSNNFVRVKHVNLFETVRLSAAAPGEETVEPFPIQKLMSVPVLKGGVTTALGVIQISRKGLDTKLAGPDFTNDELWLLERAAAIVARMNFMAGRSVTTPLVPTR